MTDAEVVAIAHTAFEQVLGALTEPLANAIMDAVDAAHMGVDFGPGAPRPALSVVPTGTQLVVERVDDLA